MSDRTVTVADLSAPTELNALSESADGNLITAYDSAGDYTVYSWNTTQITESSPYIVDGTGGSWVATRGTYIYEVTTTKVRNVDVADLSSPTELDAVGADYEGSMLIAACSSEYTMYQWHDSYLTQNLPYVVNGNGGSWLATGGKFTNFNSVVYTSQSLSSGSQTLTGLTTGIEVLALTASGAATVTNITGANAGAIKILAFDDSNFTVAHDSGTPKIILQGGVDATFSSGDILILMNRSGSQPGTTGYWREIWRTLF